MFFKIRTIPTLSAFSFGVLLVLLVGWLVMMPAVQKFIDKQARVYTEALSALTASQLVNTTFDTDRVRMQLQLQDTIKQPNVLLAAIYDLENNIVVQAGHARFDPSQTLTATSPITLDNSIEGYVSITSQPPRFSSRSVNILILIIISLLIAIIGWTLYEEDTIQLTKNTKRTSNTGQPPPQDTSDIAGVTEISEPETPTSFMLAVIHIKNFAVLYQQLSGESFRNTVTRFEKIISDVMALYGGHSFELEKNYYVLRFAVTDNQGDALFRAICSAHLVLELSGIINKIPLDLAALVTDTEKEHLGDKLPIAGLHIEESIAGEDVIAHRLELMSLSDEEGRKVVAGFVQPFKTLLENQHRQLAHIS